MEVFSLIEAERRRLADELEDLAPPDWQEASLCRGWTVHDVAAHLNLPWSVSTPTFVVGVMRSFGNVDRAMDRFSRDLARTLTPERCIEGLRLHADHRFTPPMFGPEAPLTDVVIHGADILRPLGRTPAVDPEALRVVLDFLTTKRARASFSTRDLAGLRVHVTDLDIQLGDGELELSGPALAVCGALLRRDPFLGELHGAGVAALEAKP